ncbi:MCE family protein [Nocardia bovistercoris]|uniref:MCE family protein n=1 Tax=Nocardia bovistercoris TaxID=2785916 RepID=A0A931IH84_9NOCA|nr:MCE family protein [Nocardia bovistercoris]MBH0781524.1 MCE family protein [Nocardia bovistercoris]
MADSKHSEESVVNALRDGLGVKAAGLALVLVVVALVAIALVMFVGGFTPTATVLVQAPRSGLVLDTDAKVKVRGAEIGRVVAVDTGGDGALLRLEIAPDKLRLVPSNVGVDIRSTTVFGAKYVNFVIPDNPSPTPLKPGSIVSATRVTVEFNTLFQRLSDVLAQVEPQKLNATMAALGEALDGRGQRTGELLSDSDRYLREINPYLPTLRADLASTTAVTDIYSESADDLLRTADNATFVGRTLVDERAGLDTVLANVIGLGDTAGAVLRQNETDLTASLALLRPTTALLAAYGPALGCVIDGVGGLMPLAERIFGGVLPGIGMNTNFMAGSPPYTYPDDLPKVNATGGPHCDGVVDRAPGSHADYLVTDTSQGAPYVPSTRPTTLNDPPRVFQVLFAGLPGTGAP